MAHSRVCLIVYLGVSAVIGDGVNEAADANDTKAREKATPTGCRAL